MKKIMILGAGIYQVPLILKAKEMGLSPIVVSYPGPYPGFQLADKCIYLDTRDKEAILKAACSEDIHGICTTGTDVALRTLGYVTEQLHLSGPSYQSAQIVTDKFLMRSVLEEAGVCGIPFRRIFSPEEAVETFFSFSGPVMIKAVDSSGSRGITRVETINEVPAAYDAARSVSRLPYVLMEKFIPGQEIGVDGFVVNHEIKLLLPHQKYVVTAGSTTLPGGHAFPYRAGDVLLSDIHHTVSLAVQATGLNDCAFNADVIVNGEKAYLLEIGGRCGATCIPELISIYCGFDYYKKILESALGLLPDFAASRENPCMAKLLFSPVDGIITKIHQEALTALQKDGYIFSLDYCEGASVEKVKNGTDRIGHVILHTDREDVLNQVIQKIYECIEVDGTPLSQLWSFSGHS